MISKLIDNLWRPRPGRHHRRLKKTTAPLLATEKLEDRTLLSGYDLVAFGQALAAANVTLYGAAWDADTSAQKALLGDGASYINFEDITNSDRSLNAQATDVGISDPQNIRPIWKLAGGTLIEGSTISSLEDLANATGVAIPSSEGPYLKEIADQTLLANTGLHVALDGFDPDGGPVTYTVESSNSDIDARILDGNRSIRISVAGYGDMVFELFEGRVSRVTDRIIELAQSGFYDGVLFESIINGVASQVGDPSGDSGLGFFDDQFHPELQHVQSGLLTMAKQGFDDTNDFQFGITEIPLRDLDFQTSIFGYLVEGEEVRQAINNAAVNGETPEFEISIETVDVFTDIENGTLFLNADEGYTGSSTITVTATDQDGNQLQRQFQVNVQPDSIDEPDDSSGNVIYDPADANPYLADIPALHVLAGSSLQYQLQGIDVDLNAPNGNQFFYYQDQLWLTLNNAPVPVYAPDGLTYFVNETNGLMTINVDAEMATGEYYVTVAVGHHPSDVDYQIVTIVVTDPPQANNDFVALQGDTPAAFDILANDTDNDGSIDPDTIEILTQPTHGTVTVNQDNKIVFVADGSGYMGIDSFTYRVKDDLGVYSEAATVEMSLAPEGVILVTDLLEVGTGQNRVSLKGALSAANSDSPHDAAPAGNGADIIMFDPKLFEESAQTINILDPYLITDSVTIIAPTSAEGDLLLTINGSQSTRHFTINDGIGTSLAVGLENLNLTGGRTTADGGSIYNAEILEITNSTITENVTVTGLGGAIYNTGTLKINDSLLQSNTALNAAGGAIASDNGTIILNSSVLDDNEVETSGGAIYALDSLVTLNDSTLSSNMSGLSGGGIYQDGGTLTINSSTIYDNSTSNYTEGGGVFATDTTTTINTSVFDLNRSEDDGGGIRQETGSLTIRNSTFSNNSATFGDGGAISTGAYDTTIINSTISGNLALENGGGIFISDPIEFGSAVINNSTIANNSASFGGGGLFAEHNTITLNNSIVADNKVAGSSQDVLGKVDGSYSLIESTADVINNGSNFITGQDPGLLALADNGGPTKTHALDTSSIAIDAGDPDFDPSAFSPELDQDQRGSARVSDGDNDTVSQVDLGAYEAEAILGSVDLTVKWKNTNTNASGEVNSLPSNVEFLDEWSPVVVEIWVSVTNSEVNGVASASVDFSFDSTYLTVDSIEYGNGFSQNQTGTIDNENGIVTGLGASSVDGDHGAQSLVLLARVHLSVNPIDLNAESQYIQAVGDLDFQISNSTISSPVGNATVTEGATVNLTLVPALYDLDDDGAITFKDLVKFASLYNKTPGANGADGSWAADFDRSGSVNFRDLVLFAANYGKVKGSGVFFVYPSNFDEVWQQNLLVSSSINSENPAPQTLTSETAEPVLDAARQQLAEGADDATVDTLNDVSIEIVELPDNQLAKADTTTNTIYLDVNAAGWGWFVDTTPFLNEEFNATDDPRIFSASLLGSAAGHIDLFTVLLHELNHLLGHEHGSDSGLMDPVLALGERKLSEDHETESTDDFFGSYLDPEFDGIN